MKFNLLSYVLDRFVPCHSRKRTCMMNNLGPEVKGVFTFVFSSVNFTMSNLFNLLLTSILHSPSKVIQVILLTQEIAENSLNVKPDFIICHCYDCCLLC